MSNTIDKHVGAQIKALRTARGVSQEKLAEACGITFQQIQKYEKGINRVSCGRLWQIACALEVELPYFFPAVDGVNYHPVQR